MVPVEAVSEFALRQLWEFVLHRLELRDPLLSASMGRLLAPTALA